MVVLRWLGLALAWLMMFAICGGLFYACMELRIRMAFSGMNLGP